MIFLFMKVLIIQVIDGGNTSVVLSTLMFSPIPDDHGKILKCRGENPSLPDAYLEDFFQLNVVCEYSEICGNYVQISISCLFHSST